MNNGIKGDRNIEQIFSRCVMQDLLLLKFVKNVSKVSSPFHVFVRNQEGGGGGGVVK